MSNASPVFGIVGWKNSGKTTLIERLIVHFSAQGLAVSTIKHTHHDVDVDVDRAGTDSWRHREAGAVEVLLATTRRTIVFHELRGAAEPSLTALLQRLRPVDLVLVEGFKGDRHPKLEVSRRANGQALIARDDPSIRAVAADYTPSGLALPCFELADIDGIAALVRAEVLH